MKNTPKLRFLATFLTSTAFASALLSSPAAAQSQFNNGGGTCNENNNNQGNQSGQECSTDPGSSPITGPIVIIDPPIVTDPIAEIIKDPACNPKLTNCTPTNLLPAPEDWEEVEQPLPGIHLTPGAVLPEIIDIIQDEVTTDPVNTLSWVASDNTSRINRIQFAKLLLSGLSARNIEAAGRGISSYNNLLSDTIFDRHPLRQFKKESENDAAEAHSKDSVLKINGNEYVEDPSLTGQYARRTGWRAWSRGFGGNARAPRYSIIANDFSVNTGGLSIGADKSIAKDIQLGVYANYGHLSISQGGFTGGGKWNPNGWGGGITADYWKENFYVQGIFGASGFSGTQSRGILFIADGYGGNSATGEKSASSILGALRVGAPLQSGSVYLEPRLTASWSNNHESQFNESGVPSALQLNYGSYSSNFLQTALGLKVAIPIDSGKQAQWVPNFRLAWLADWNLNNGAQTLGYTFTNRTVKINPASRTSTADSGLLVEAGVDYTIANINSSSIKIYALGGAEFWGERTPTTTLARNASAARNLGNGWTTWRASGGFTIQF